MHGCMDAAALLACLVHGRLLAWSVGLVGLARACRFWRLPFVSLVVFLVGYLLSLWRVMILTALTGKFWRVHL